MRHPLNQYSDKFLHYLVTPMLIEISYGFIGQTNIWSVTAE